MELPATLADRPYLQGSLATMPAPTKPPADDDAWHKVAYGFDATCGMLRGDHWQLDGLFAVFEDWLDAEVEYLPVRGHNPGFARKLMNLELGFDSATQIFLRSGNVEMTLDEIDGWFVDAYYDLRDAVRDREMTSREWKEHIIDRAYCDKLSGSRPAIDALQAWDLDESLAEKPETGPAPDEGPVSPVPAAPPVLPQAMQSSDDVKSEQPRDVASVIAATAGKLAATPENIQAAAKASLADELAAIPISKTNEELMEDKVLAESKQAEARLDELLEDVQDGVVNFETRKNKHNVVVLIEVDGRRCWLRKGSYDIYLERDGLAQGVIVCTQAPTGAWVPTVRRDEIREWLKLKPGPSAKDAPEVTSRASLVGAPATGAALDEIGEFARNASREDAP